MVEQPDSYPTRDNDNSGGNHDHVGRVANGHRSAEEACHPTLDQPRPGHIETVQSPPDEAS